MILPLPSIIHGTVAAVKPSPRAANRPGQTDRDRCKHILAQLATDSSIALNSSVPFGVTAHYLIGHTQREGDSSTFLHPLYDHFHSATRGSHYGHGIGREQFARHVNRWALAFGQRPLAWDDRTIAVHGMGMREVPLDDAPVEAFIAGLSLQER